MRWEFNDGGRKAAEFRGYVGDCATRAIAIASGLQYREVYALVNDAAKDERYKRGRVGVIAAAGRGSSAREGDPSRNGTRCVYGYWSRAT